MDRLKAQFEAIDADGSGLVTPQELANSMKECQMNVNQAQVDKIISEIDYFGNGKINYSEFLAATISMQSILTDEKLWSLFKTFDTDDTDFISFENLQEAFQRLGRSISDAELEAMLTQHDQDKNRRLSFDEFKAVFINS